MEVKMKSNIQKAVVHSLPVALVFTFALLATGCFFVADGDGSSATRPSAPDAPSGIGVRIVSSDTVQISWDDAPEARSYRLYWSDSASGPFWVVEGARTVYRTSFNAVISPGWTYYFRVTGVNSAGESVPSDTVSARLGSQWYS
jgi:hypothetical protein